VFDEAVLLPAILMIFSYKICMFACLQMSGMAAVDWRVMISDKLLRLPVELHSLDVEAQSGTDRCDVFTVDSSHDSGLACVVQAPAANQEHQR
jgi:hypothetical protein